MSGDGSGRARRAWRYLTEREVIEVERRLALYRANTPQRIAADVGLHPNTVTKINLGRHPIQARLGVERRQG
jgi:hypothetical protein